MADPAGSRSSTGSVWQRRIVHPLRTQLTQGTSPGRLAATLGIGTACSLFPFLGFTALLNLGVGLPLRLNQPILQTLNQLLGPLQILLIIPHVRLGETLWGANSERFTLSEMIAVFQDASVSTFLARFGWAGIHALSAWLLLAPLAAGLVYHGSLPLLQRLAKRKSP